MRVLCYGPGYPLSYHLDRWKRKEFPGHLLYGITEFEEHGISCVFPPVFKRESGLIGRVLRHLFGNIKEQLWALKHQSEYDVVYASLDIEVRLLLYARRIGLFKKPIAGLIHGLSGPHEVNCISRFWRKFYIKGMDAIGCLSHLINKNLISYDASFADKSTVILMGPEVIATDTNEDSYFVSAGKTYRDISTLCKAMEGVPCDLILACPRELLPKSIPSNVKYYGNNVRHEILFNELYVRSFAVIVPVKSTRSGVYGLSSIADAFAVNKPVITAKTPGLAFDIDNWNCGITYEPGNVNALKDAILEIYRNSDRRKSMANSVRATTKWLNLQMMTKQIVVLIHDACQTIK